MDFTREGIQWDQSYIIFHGIDVDGVLSGALLDAHLTLHEGGSHISNSGKPQIHLVPIDIPNIPETIQSLEERIHQTTHLATTQPIPSSSRQLRDSNPPRARIIFADLAFNESLNNLEDTVKYLSTHHQLELYDPEHRMNASRLKPFFSTIITPEQFPGQHISTGSFLAKHLFPNSSLHYLATSYLGRLCQGADYPEESPPTIKNDSKRFQEAIQSLSSPESLVGYFSCKILNWPIYELQRNRKGLPRNYLNYFWAPRFTVEVKDYRRKTRHAFTDLKRSTHTFEISPGFCGAIGFAPDILYMKPGIQSIVETSKLPFSVCVFESGKVIFSKNEQGINPVNALYHAIHCGDIGKLFDGGGRETGGGGDLKRNVTPKDYPTTCYTILTTLREHYFKPLIAQLGL